MVNTLPTVRSAVVPVRRWVTGYLGLVAASLVALVVLSLVAPRFASTEAWVHTVIVVVFAVVLQLRLFSVEKGSVRALRSLAVIAGVLAVVNVVEAVLPGLFPVWMRITMVLIAVLMVGLLVAAVRAARVATSGPDPTA